MASKIEWLARPGTKPETWNPIIGCTKVSPGCAHCYAERMAVRQTYMRPGCEYSAVVQFDEDDRIPWEQFPAGWNGRVQWVESQRDKPYRWRDRRTVFVCSMSDLFHDDVLPAWQTAVWEVMDTTRDHTYILLTKRAENMARRLELLIKAFGVLPNVWLCVTCEDQARADERIPWLLRTPAAVRGLSVEPMLSTVLPPGGLEGIDWVICGGESGPGARPMGLDWARDLRDHCYWANVPFFFKQDGPRRGHLLDGREWRQWPSDAVASARRPEDAKR